MQLCWNFLQLLDALLRSLTRAGKPSLDDMKLSAFYKLLTHYHSQLDVLYIN